MHASTSRSSRRLPRMTGIRGRPSWSPDGKTIAYEAEVNGVVQIFTRTLGSSMRTRVTNSAIRLFHLDVVG